MLAVSILLIGLVSLLISSGKSKEDRFLSNVKKQKAPQSPTRSSEERRRRTNLMLLASGGCVTTRPWQVTSAAQRTLCSMCLWSISVKDRARCRLIIKGQDLKPSQSPSGCTFS